MLLENDYIPINPFKITNGETDWEKCMLICIRHLFNCDCIYMIEGWENSRGARIEYSIAKELNIEDITQKINNQKIEK